MSKPANDEFADNILNDLRSGISHGILVGNLSYELAKRLGMTESEAYDIKVAGLVHDIGKLKLSPYLYGRNTEGLTIEETKYMRMHSKIGYEYLKEKGYSDFILDIVLRHHECYDGSGYPGKLQGEAIPVGARIIKLTDEFAALIADRPYRKAFDIDTAVDIIIEEIKNMDMRVFIEFQRMIHEDSTLKLIKDSAIKLDDLDVAALFDIRQEFDNED
jgi:putative nucleotidyltransferase with HDIG domain